MRKILSILIAVFVLASMLPVVCNAENHEHEWVEATCTEPKTCSVCGETDGQPLEHDWREACIAAPKRCTRCGLTEGACLNKTPREFIKLFNATFKNDGMQIKEIRDVNGDNWYLSVDGLEYPAMIQFMQRRQVAGTGTGDIDMKREDWDLTAVNSMHEGAYSEAKMDIYKQFAVNIGTIFGDEITIDELEVDNNKCEFETDYLRYQLEYNNFQGGFYELRIRFQKWE